MPKITITDILQTASIYGDDCRELKKVLDKMEEELASVRAKYQAQIVQLSKAATKSKIFALELLSSNPQFFSKPRTQRLNGVELGYRKITDSLEIIDEALTIELISQYLPELYPVLVKQSLSLVKEGLKHLSKDERTLIKVFMTSGKSNPYIKLMDRDLSKLIEATLNMVA